MNFKLVKLQNVRMVTYYIDKTNNNTKKYLFATFLESFTEWKT